VAIAFGLLVGCNSVFGNDQVASAPPIDARFFDAPIDAPPACPSSGAPMFRTGLFQVPAPNLCSDFSIAENGTLMAVCPGSTAMVLYTGTVADGLQPAAHDLPAVAQPIDVRLAPEGDLAIVQVYMPGVGRETHALRFDPVASLWHDLGTFTIRLGFVSTPTRAAPDRHMLLYDVTDDQFFDYVGDNNTWTEQPPYTTTGFHSVNSPFALTPDGLRIVANASPMSGGFPVLLYGTRPDLESPFLDSSSVDEASSILQPALSEDCGELYFIGLDRILYVKQ
jgi:hypothetical protein